VRTHEPVLMSVVIRQDIVNNDAVLAPKSLLLIARGPYPSPFEISSEVVADKAYGFFDLVHEIGLIEHIVMPDRDQLFEIICQELAANVHTADGLLDGSAVEERCYCGMREAGINHKKAFDGRCLLIGFTWRSTKEIVNVVVRLKRWTYLNVSKTLDAADRTTD